MQTPSTQALDTGIVMVVAIYDRLDDAQRARALLLGEGVSADDVGIDIADDEAGPPVGNFVSGNGASGADPYRANFAAPRDHGRCVMTVSVEHSRSERAREILKRCGARIAS